jgi:hypothetical protein
MRRGLAIVAASAFVAASTAFAATGGGAAPKPGLNEAIARTTQAASERYKIHVRLERDGQPLSLHIRGRTSRSTIAVAMRMGDVELPDGTTVPGPNGAALLDGPFLYERAPSSDAQYGKVHWLRLSVAHLAPSSVDMKAVHAMSPRPVLDALAAARMAPAQPGARVYHGTLAYDDPAVRVGLAKLTGDIEFRNLHIAAFVGGDGLVHRVVLTGRTADGRSTISLRAHLYGFGTAVHVTPPEPGTFIDDRDQLTA